MELLCHDFNYIIRCLKEYIEEDKKDYNSYYHGRTSGGVHPLRSNSKGLHLNASVCNKDIGVYAEEMCILSSEYEKSWDVLNKVKEFKNQDKHKYVAAKIRTTCNGSITSEVIQMVRDSVIGK